jgi:hypothetical protein
VEVTPPSLDFVEPVVADVALPDVHFIPWRVADATFVEIEILHPLQQTYAP